MAQGEGVAIDVSAIPSLPTIERHVRAQVQFTETDDGGTLCASFGSFPLGVNSAAPASLLLAAPVLAIGIPRASKAQGNAQETICAVNLRGIGQAMYIHAQDDGRFPSSFQVLLDENNITPKQLICPSTSHVPGDPVDSCYVIVPGQTTYSDPHNVLVYERPENHGGKGVNVLYQDGHVEFITVEKLNEQLAATRERLKQGAG